MRSKGPGGTIITLLNVVVTACIAYFAVRVVLLNPPEFAKTAKIGNFGGLLWGPRALDALGQAVILFGSILGIILLFRTEESQ